MKIVILGASGDLAKRKLFPNLALLNLKDIQIIAYARSNIVDTFHEKISEYGSYTKEFLNNVKYIQGSYENIVLSSDDNYDEEYIFYFSVPPSTYLTLLESLKKFTNSKIAIEKPFATDIENYKLISRNPHLYLIDHYLLKPIVNCMPIIRKRIVLKHFYEIEFLMKEELGIEGRVYFNETGIVKDMLQNHLMVLYTTLLGGERADVLKNSKIVDSLLGQYNGYEDELGQISETETYALMFMKNNCFDNAIFTFQVGKGLDEKRTQIRIKYLQEFYKVVINQTLRDQSTYKDISLDLISSVELVIDVAKNSVYFELVMDECKQFYLFDKHQIKDLSSELSGALDDHALVFDCLIKNKSFATTSVEEGLLQWELFKDVKGKLFYYDKGVSMPKEASQRIEELSEKYKK